MKLKSLLFSLLISVISFAQVPTITSLSTYSANVGAAVTITGTGFSGSSKVLIGNIYVTPTSVTGSTQLSFVVPKVPVYANVSVKQGSALSNTRLFRTTQKTGGSLNISWAGGNYFANTTELVITSPSSGYANNTEINSGDFDNDGDADFLIPSGNDVQIILNNGSGIASQYTTSTITTGFTASIFHISSGDIDADGDIDFVASPTNGSGKAFFNNGSGTFSTVASFSTVSSGSHLIELSDFDLDGDLDIAAIAKSPSSSKHVQIFTNVSNSFTTVTDVTGPATNMSSDKRSASGDIDGDGISELFYTHYQGGLYMAKKTSGTWAVTLLSNNSGVYSYTGSGDVSLLDYDADGDLDILLHTSANQIFINSSGSFSSIPNNLFSGEGRTLLWDIDADGDLDGFENYHYYPQLKLRQFSSNNLDGSGNELVNSPAGSGVCSSFEVIDVNGDLYPDIVFYQNNRFYVRLFQGNPTPTITTSVNTLSAFSACAGSVSTNQSFTVSGSTLSAGIVITPPTGFEISSTSATAGYQTTALTLNQSGGTVSNTTIYVRTTSSASGSPSGNITLTSTGATQKNVAVSGTVNALPTITTQPTTTAIVKCWNEAAQALTVATSASSPTYQWQESTTSNGTYANVTTGTGGTTSSFSPLHTNISWGNTKYYRCVVTSNGCAATSNASAGYTIGDLAITSQPSTTAQTYCQGATPTPITMSASANGLAITYLWHYATTPTGSYYSVVGGTGGSTNTYTPPTTTAGTLYYKCYITYCGGASMWTAASGAITVNANNTVGSASSTPTLCVNTALTNITHATTGVTGIGTATGLPAGVTASFASNTITITGTPTASGTFSYTIPTTGGCGSVNATGTITVTAANTVGSASSSPSVCIGSAITNVTHTTSGVTGIGTATGLPVGVTASFASNIITISGTPSASGTFSYTIPTTGGCGSLNATGTITVNANTAGTASATPSVCNGSSMTSITHSTTGATGIGMPSGLPGGMNVSFSSNTVTISGSPSNTFAVGNFYNGGRIAYIFQPGDNGYTPGKVLIVDPSYKYGPTCTGFWTMGSQTATTSTALGEGLNNTDNLFTAGHTSTSQAIGYAYNYTDGVYSDWFVPSKDELALIFNNLPTYTPAISGGFQVRSSSEIVGSLGQTHAYYRSGGVVYLSAQNDGGCGAMMIARYDVLPTASAVQAYNYTIPLTGGCGTTNATGTITITDTYTWTGTTSTDPSVATNWNPASVPCGSANEIIPAGLTNYPSYTSLTIASGTTMTVQSGARLTVTGVLTNNGTLTIESGATFLQGTSLAGTGTYNVKQTVTGSNDGTNPTGRFWYMGVPINNLTRATAFGTAGTQNRLWSWSESAQAWSSQLGDATALTPTTGYSFRTGSDVTLNFSGTSLYSANPSITGLTNTTGSFSGCHLMSNPFTAYADWEQIYTASTNISSTYCVRSFNTTNSQMVYDTYNATGDVAVQNGSYAVTQYIAPMQSFWIIVDPSTTGTFNMTKAMLSHQPSATGLKDLSTFNAFARLNLIGGNLSDQVVVYMTPDATNTLDAYDSKKMMLSNVPQVYTTLGTDKLVINGLKESKAHTIVPLTLELPTSQSYHFEMAESNVNYGLVILEDREELVFQDMTANPDYAFFAQAGISSDRFVLHFHFPLNTASTDEIGSSAQIDIVSNNTGAVNVHLSDDLQVGGEITVLDQAGRLVAKKTITQAQTLVQINETAGVYFVRVQTPGKTEIKKVVLY